MAIFDVMTMTGVFRRPFPFTRQFDQMDCGPACVSMLAKYYGKNLPLSYLRSLAQLNRGGVSVAGIRDALGIIGMESATFELTVKQLYSVCPLPAILHWDQNHFVVLYDVKHSVRGGKKWLYSVANPAYGKHTYTEKDFQTHWLNGDKGIAIVAEPTSLFYNIKIDAKKQSIVEFARKHVWPHKKGLFILAIGLLVGTVLSMITPFLTQALVDQGIGQKNINIITSLLLAQLAIFLGSFTMNVISSWVALYMSTHISIDVLHEYLAKLLRLPISFFETKSVGDYQQRIADHSRLQGFATQATLQTGFSIMTGLILLVIIGIYSLKILFFFLFMTIISTLWMAYFWRERKSLDYESFKLSAQNHNKLFEMLNGIIDIKVNSYGNYKIHEWESMQQKQYMMSKKVLRLEQIQGTGYSLIGQFRNIIITFWVAVEVVNGNLTLGMMMSISAIVGQLAGPLSQLIGFLQQFQDARISLERSNEVHMCADEDNDSMKIAPHGRPLDIAIRDLTFCYPGSFGKTALKNVNIDLPAGKMTAVVGESGSGKSTLLKLLLKFYDIEQGNILLGGEKLNSYKSDSLRQTMGIVMQDNFIFSDTIKNNIIMGLPEDPYILEKAIRTACLSDYVSALPLGINTKIGAEGSELSGGERQRLMLARAIYKQPLYLFLDEATSSLDAENERKITDNIAAEFVGKTILVIAHRLSTVKNADNIIVLRHGEVVEKGKHDNLIKLRGYYYELVKNQLEIPD